MNMKPGKLCGVVRNVERTAAGRPHGKMGRAMALEPLEARRLFTTATLGSDGILTIVGTEGEDYIRVCVDEFNPAALCVYDYPHHLLLTSTGVLGVHVDARGGDDGVYVTWREDFFLCDHDASGWQDLPIAHFDVPVTIHGGAGDDAMCCESTADDVLIGDAGRDQASVMFGNDLFSIEFVEDYRNRRNNSFIWADAGNHLFPDPFETIIYEGTYWGTDYFVQPVKPTPVEPTPVDGDTNDAQDGQAAQDAAADVTPAPTGGDSTEAPDDVTAPPADAVIAPPALAAFSTTPIKPAHGHVWDDAAEL